LHSNQPGLQYQ